MAGHHCIAVSGIFLLTMLVLCASGEEAKQQQQDTQQGPQTAPLPQEGQVAGHPSRGGMRVPGSSKHRKELPQPPKFKRRRHDQYGDDAEPGQEPEQLEQEQPEHTYDAYGGGGGSGSDQGPKRPPSHSYTKPPSPAYGGSPGVGGPGVGGPGGDVGLAPEFEQQPCITRLEDYARAFNRGGVERCVDPSILVRIDQYFMDLKNTTKNGMFGNFIGARSKAVTFWSLDDNPEKYIRIGRDALQLGNFVDAPPGNVGYQSGAFPGIRDAKNFAALLEAVGYGSADSNPKRAYLLVVTRRPRSPRVSVYNPTWANVLIYFEYYISQVAANDPAALAMANISAAQADTYRSFAFDPDTLPILRGTTFADLSSCQAQCIVQDTAWGNASVPDWTTPTVVVPRASNTSCNATAAGKLPPRYEWTEPTIIEAGDGFCSPTWIKYRTLYSVKTVNATTGQPTSFWCGAGAQNPTENRGLALVMARAYLAATTPQERAVALRAYLTTSCAGTFNALFSGDGFTYTGNGGYLGATGTELHAGEVLRADVPLVYPSIRLVFVCPYRPDSSGPFVHAVCPDSLGRFDADYFRTLLNAPDWDVAEVKHPSEL